MTIQSNTHEFKQTHIFSEYTIKHKTYNSIRGCLHYLPSTTSYKGENGFRCQPMF